MVSGVPAIMSPTFRGHGANVSEGTLIMRGVGNGGDTLLRLQHVAQTASGLTGERCRTKARNFNNNNNNTLELQRS